MTKYDDLKYIIKMKAKIQHSCHQCGKYIEVGELYYKEKIDVKPSPNFILREFYEKCGSTLAP
jgi:hypothetical protein